MGAGVVGGRLCGVRDLPVAGRPVSGTPFPVGAKSDAADAHLLADIVRLDRAYHRRTAGDSEIAAHPREPARGHPPRLPANPHTLYDEHLVWQTEPDDHSSAA